MFFRRVTGVLVFLFSCACWGQPDLRYLSHQSWSTEEGLPQNSVHAILETTDGYLWVATEAGLARFDGLSFRIFNRATEPLLTSDDFCCLALDHDGALLAQSADQTIRIAGDHLTRSSGSLPPATTPGVYPSKSRVQATLTDREGLTWIGTRNGLVILAPGSDKPLPVPSFASDSILSLFEDAEGNHWIGTETAGLHVLRRSKFRSEPSVSNFAVTSVVQASDGAMWIGTRDEGLRRLTPGRMDEPAPIGMLTSAVILALAPGPDGSVWAGTPDGLNLVSPAGQVKHISSMDGLPDDYIRALASEPDGSVWIGNQHGLARWKSGRVQVFTTAEGLASDIVGSLLFDGAMDRLWIGTSNGLSTLSGPGPSMVSTLKGKIVSSIAPAPAHSGWIATQSGEVLLVVSDGSLEPVSGLPGSRISSISADGQGYLWLRMDRGIWRIAERSLVACTTKLCTPADIPIARYGVSDGLPSDETVAGSPSAGWLARDGEIWFPTRRGLAIADTLHLPVDTVAPPVVIEGFSADGTAEPDGANLPYGGQRFTFDYAGLNFTAPGEVRYRVRLEGFDKEWIEAGTKRSATYTNLPPGPYRFRVEAVNGDGFWNHAGATLEFRVLAPFYRRWWFIGLVVLALGLILAGLYLLRLRGLQRGFDAVLAERNRMAREIHDTLTQDFVGTSLQLDIITGMLKKGRVEQALEQVARTRRLVTEGLDEARQSIWELRANNSEDALPTRMTRLVQREAFTPLAAKLRVTGAYRALEPRVEREVLRIAQEALSNVLRHAQASETKVDLHYSDEALLLTIEDNGRGFDSDKTAHADGHYGLVGMRERAATIDGKLEVTSRVGTGTKVVVRVAVS
jgi:ligand-binding sensor domain-containing protein